MKKTIIKALTFSAVFAAILSCKKEEAPEARLGEAIVEGHIEINSNTYNDITKFDTTWKDSVISKIDVIVDTFTVWNGSGYDSTFTTTFDTTMVPSYNNNYDLTPIEWDVVFEGIPTDIQLTFVIDSKELERKADPNFEYDKIYKTVTVDANGYYKVTLPTAMSNKVVNGELRIDDFSYDPVIPNYNHRNDSTDKRVDVTGPTIPFTIYSGGKTQVNHRF